MSTIQDDAIAAGEAIQALQKKSVKDLVQETGKLADHYARFEITTTDEYVDAAEHLQSIKRQQDKVASERFAITRPMDAAKQAVMAFFRPFSERLEEAETHVKRAMVAYKTEQDRIAQEQARIEREKAEKEAKRLREEARKADEAAAAKERKRLAEEQRKADARAAKERARIEAEREAALAAQDAEAERRAAEQLEAQQRREQVEQERLHQERLDAEAEQRERSARADTLEQRAATVTAAPTIHAPKVKGVSTRQVWRFEIVDASKVPDQYKIIDEKSIGGVVRSLKERTNIPGVRVYPEDVVSARK